MSKKSLSAKKVFVLDDNDEFRESTVCYLKEWILKLKTLVSLRLP